MAASGIAKPAGLVAWVNAGNLARYPGVLNDSTPTGRWATPRLVYRISGAVTDNDTYYHQFLMTLGYGTSDSSVITGGSVLGSYYAYGVSTHPIVSNGTGGVAPTRAWVDRGTHKVSYVEAASPSGEERWALPSSPDTRNVTSSGVLSETGYRDQLALTFSYLLAGGGNPTAPSLSCNSLGSPWVANLTTSPRRYFCDEGATWTLSPAVLNGSGVSERWETQASLSGLVNGTVTRAFPYQHQVLMVFEFSVVGGGTPANPSVLYFQYGAAQGVSATGSGVSVWADVGSSYTYSNPSSDSTGSERWAAAATPSSTVTAASTVNPSYYHQYLDTLQYAVSGGGSPNAPLVSFARFGSAASQHASTDTSIAAWIDAGATVTYPASITDGTSTWTTSTTSFTSALLATFDPTYSM
jgi:hypothetical protein